MREIFDFLTQHLFITGILIGGIFALFVWLRGLIHLRSLRKEMAKLKETVYTKMQIEAKGIRTQGNELDRLKSENENLRITVSALQQKPERAEIRQLHVYDRAIHAMLARAPGFSQSWELVLKEAEDEIRQTETGVAAFIRKVFLPGKPTLEVTSSTPVMGKDDSREGS
jgi:hypothetical protein